MAKNIRPRGDGAVQSSDVPDQLVSQVGKAAVQILKLREILEADLAKTQSEEERQTLAAQVESAAVQVIDEQGITVEEYNEVLSAARQDPELEERVLLACRSN